jgi:hypothetical protein
MTRPLVIVSLSAAVFLILAGAAYFLFSRPPVAEPPPPGPPTSQPAPANEGKPPPEQPTASFEQGIENLEIAIREVCTTGESKELTLVITEEEANEQAADLLARTEVPENIPLEVESVRIDFQTDNSVVTVAKSITHGFKVTIEVAVLVVAEEGKPKVTVTNINFGILPIPDVVKDEITAFITQETENLWNRLLSEVSTDCNGGVDLEVTQISTQEDKVTVIVLVRRTT